MEDKQDSTKMTDKQFREDLKNPKYTRSELKRWKRSYYLTKRDETPLQYLMRMLNYLIR